MKSLWKFWSELRPIQDWQEFWFRERSLTGLGLFRIGLGLTVLMKLLLLLPVLGDFYSETGMLTLEQSQRTAYPPRICIFDYLPPHLTPTVFWVLILFGIMLTFGFQTRLSAIVLFIGLMSIDNRNSWVTNSGDRLTTLFLFYGIFSAMGSALSVDRLLRIFKGKVSSIPATGYYWPARLVQLQICTMYYWSSFIKLKGQSWPGGEALYWTSKNLERARFPLPFGLGHSMIGLNLLTYFTLVVEGLFPFLIWSKRTRWYAITGALLLHIGIEQTMTIQVFSYIVLCGFLMFFYGEEYEIFWDRLRKRFLKASQIPVFFDGDCGFCTRSVNVLRSMDILHRLDIQNFRIPALKEEYPDLDLDRNDQELTLKSPTGQWYGGFRAFRWMAWRLPVAWFIAPFLYLPGAAWLGDRAYKWIAGHRYLISGGGSACALPTMPSPPPAISDDIVTETNDEEAVSAGDANG